MSCQLCNGVPHCIWCSNQKLLGYALVDKLNGALLTGTTIDLEEFLSEKAVRLELKEAKAEIKKLRERLEQIGRLATEAE